MPLFSPLPRLASSRHCPQAGPAAQLSSVGTWLAPGLVLPALGPVGGWGPGPGQAAFNLSFPVWEAAGGPPTPQPTIHRQEGERRPRDTAERLCRPGRGGEGQERAPPHLPSPSPSVAPAGACTLFFPSTNSVQVSRLSMGFTASCVVTSLQSRHCGMWSLCCRRLLGTACPVRAAGHSLPW